MQRVFLVVIKGSKSDRPIHRLCIREELDLTEFDSSVRTSPIFSFAQAAGRIPQIGQNYLCKFFSVSDFANAVSVIPHEIKNEVWFTLGVASIVVISENHETVELLTEKLESLTNSSEAWSIEQGEIVATIPSFAVGHTGIDVREFLVSNTSTLPEDITSIINELNHNLHEVATRANAICPAFMETLRVTAERARAITDEIHFELEVLEKSKTGATADPLEIQKEINQQVDQLVSLNSTLAYVSSQAFYGEIPLLEGCGCLIRNHSLLGVGSAHEALRKLITYIENGFVKFPVLKAAEEAYKVPNKSLLDSNGRLSFVDNLISLDQFMKDRGEDFREEAFPKIVYFSSRHGFSEAPGIVTAATQVLSGADTTRWSLLTITHEMMHAYFDAICAQILGSAEEEDPLDAILTMAQALVDKGKGFSAELDTPEQAILAQFLYLSSLIRSARQARSEVESSWDIDEELKVDGYSSAVANEYLSDLINVRKIIEECVVHSLDLFYFYQGRRPRYISALWLSWSTVPGVVENLEFYILRSLVCIGYDLPGAIIPNRFDAAITLLSRELEAIKDADGKPAAIVIRKTISFLQDPKNRDLLAIMFEPLCEFVELFRNCFFSDNLKIYFEANDAKVVAGKFESEYALDTGELSGEKIQNPIAFLADRLRRSLLEMSESMGDDYRSAWLILMIGTCEEELL